MELERDSLDVSIRPSVDMWTWILIASRDWWGDDMITRVVQVEANARLSRHDYCLKAFRYNGELIPGADLVSIIKSKLKRV
jgi:hypothetical protein